MNTRDFLFELGTEELPPVALPELERALSEGIRNGLASAGLPHGDLVSYAAPRRLAVLVRDLAEQQPEQLLKRRGPPVSAAFDKTGQPTRAATAFAESCGVDIGSLGRITEGKGEFLYFEGSKPGAPTPSLLAAIVQTALDALPIPKRMRWGASQAEFVRPVHWVVLRFGDEVLDATLLDTRAGSTTRGHRFHAPGELSLPTPADYADVLRSSGHVIAHFNERRERIREQVESAALRLGGRAVFDDALLDEVTALVEWPVPVEGRFDDEFLELPREVLISTLQEHQRYFPVEDAAGKLTPYFITISNIDSRDPSRVREGNERVVRPRLSDAAFFQRQDRRAPLRGWRDGLDRVTFQAKLGSIGDKVRRIASLASQIAPLVGGQSTLAMQAAELSKCDLHYLPRGAGDELPSTASGIAVALADKLDTLAGIFGIGQKPSGTKDPFALRRAAIGVLRILLERRLDLDLADLVAQAVALQPVSTPDTQSEVLGFMMDRLRAIQLEAGHGSEAFDAVQATGSTKPGNIQSRLEALRRFRELPEAESLAAANKRIANILKKTETGTLSTSIDAALLREPAERALAAALDAIASSVDTHLRRTEYDAALTLLASLRPTIDAFFNDVMVNDPDAALRANRLALVNRVRTLFSGVADLSRLPG